MMRIALLADIHGNSIALDAVLGDITATGGVDAYWILGDLTAIGHDPVGVLDRLTRLPNVQIIRGNADDYVVSGKRPPPTIEQAVANPNRLPVLAEVSATFAWTLGMVTAAGWLEWLSQLPLEFRTQLPDGTAVLCVHAAPGTEHGWGILPDMDDETVSEILGDCPAGLICVGHTHYVIDRRVGRWHIVNPGSISNARHHDLRASYAILTAEATGYQIEQRRVDYDREAAVQALEALRHPARQFIIRCLQKGINDTFFPLRHLTFQPINQAQIDQMTSWRYSTPYDIYNLTHPANSDELAYYLDPSNAYHAILNGAGEMVAFCSFGPDGQVGGGDYSANALDIGMGVRPDLTGQGLGKHFVRAAIDYAQRLYQPSTLRVTIAAFNQRAIRLWEKRDFQKVQAFSSSYDGREFIVFVNGEWRIVNNSPFSILH